MLYNIGGHPDWSEGDMVAGLAEPEFVKNPENRCPVVLLLDTSGSMSGEPIEQLNQGIATFKEELVQDPRASMRVELAIVTFGPVRLEQDFVTVDNFNPPHFAAQDMTPMGEAIRYGLDLLERRKATYRRNGIQYYRPWMFLITDGAPTDEWQSAARLVHEAEANKRIAFFAVGVEGADMNILSQIAPPNRPPQKLRGLCFRELFVWLSASLTGIANSRLGEQITLPPNTGWTVLDNDVGSGIIP